MKNILFWILVTLYALSFCLLLFYGFSGNLTGFFHIGKRQLIYRRYFRNFNYYAPSTWGYDGQFYLAVAHDPFLKEGLWHYLDSPAYRYSKIIFPLAAYLAASGQKPLIPAAMIILNFSVFFISCFLFLKLIEKYRAPPFLLLIYGFLPCFTIGLFWTTADSVAAGLMAASLYFLDEKKWSLAGGLMILAALTKETTLLIPAGALIYFLFKRDFWKAGLFFLPFLFYLLLGGLIFFKMGRWPFMGNSGSFNWPLADIWQKTDLIFKNKLTVHSLAIILWLANLVLAAVLSAKAVFQKRTSLSISYGLTGLLMLSLSLTIWENILGFGRITSLVGILGLFYFLKSKDNWQLLPPICFALISFLFLIIEKVFRVMT